MKSMTPLQGGAPTSQKILLPTTNKLVFLLLALFLLALIPSTSTQAQMVKHDYGPTAKANEWQQFTIPLTAKAWGTTDATFDTILASVKMVQFSFEMSNGVDRGAIDNVSIGRRFTSSFTGGEEGWSSGGDGTMAWSATAGVQGGCLTILDHSTGILHYATTPLTWAGDWRSMKGQNIVFSVRTDQNHGPGRVEIHSGDVKRLTLSAKPYLVRPGKLSTLTLTLGQPASADSLVQLSSNNAGVFLKPKNVLITKGKRLATTTIQAAASAKKSDLSIITATLSGYPPARVTLTVDPDGSEPPPPPGGTSIGAMADSHVYAYDYRNWNRCNWGVYEALGLGPNSQGGDKRIYIKFDVSQLNIPAGKRVSLRLFHYHSAGATDPLGIFRVTSPWKEGRGTYHSGKTEPSAGPGEISWVNQPTFLTTAEAQFSPGAKANKHIEIDVTDLVKSWQSGQPNHGMMLAGLRGTRATSVYGFYSREYKDPDKRPALVISGDDPPPPPTGELQVRADHKRIKKGEAFYIPIWLDFPKTFPRTRDGRINAANLNVEISYNPNVLKAGTKILPGNVLKGALFQANPGQPGVIKLGFATKKGIQDSGSLAQLIFQAVGQPGQRSPLSVRITTVNDDQGRTPRTRVVHGYVEIVKEGLPGDINGNGIIDAGDALSALKMSVGLIPQNLILNVDKKDQVTSNDARLLLQMAVQGGTTPPPKVSNPPPKQPVVNTPNKTPAVVTATTADARRAYQEYIAAYNKMTSLMAKGQGDTPAAKQAYAAYKAAKDKYEAAIKNQPTKEGVR